MTLEGVGGGNRNSWETGILGKRENWGIFILRIGDPTLTKLDIKKDLMSQMLHFRLELDSGT